MSVRTRLLLPQFRRPRGPLGLVVGRIMSNRSSNVERSEWTVGLLDLQPGDRVLELGYGPGIGIEAVVERLGTGTVVGLDHSPAMRRMASRRVRGLGRDVTVDLRVGDAQAPPDDLGTFDRIFSCNVWLFWKEPVAVLERLRSNLAPGGTMAVTHLPRQDGATRDTALAAASTIAAQLEEAGYLDVRREVLDLEPVPVVCVLATP